MDEIELLKREIEGLKNWKKSLEASFSIPLNIDQALQGRGFSKSGSSSILLVVNGGTGVATLTGIVKGNGAGVFTAIVPKSGTGSFYVSATSGGPVTTKVDWSNGVITAIT